MNNETQHYAAKILTRGGEVHRDGVGGTPIPVPILYQQQEFNLYKYY